MGKYTGFSSFTFAGFDIMMSHNKNEIDVHVI